MEGLSSQAITLIVQIFIKQFYPQKLQELQNLKAQYKYIIQNPKSIREKKQFPAETIQRCRQHMQPEII